MRSGLIRCCDCSFWHVGQDHGQGTCHRKAPAPAVGRVGQFSMSDVFWPPTTHDDGCGEGHPWNGGND